MYGRSYPIKKDLLRLNRRIDTFNALTKNERRRNTVYAFIPSGQSTVNPDWLRSTPKAAFQALCNRLGGVETATNTVNEGKFMLASFHVHVKKDPHLT